MSRSSVPSSSSKTPETTSSSNFEVIFEKALKAYNKNTKQDLTAHPLAARLQTCDSPAAILTILQEQVDQFKQSRSADERLHKWLNPTINVLYAFSQTLGEGIGLVFSPAKVIFAGAGVLLLAAKEVEASQDIIVDIFERIENFFRRLEVYTEVPPTPAMADMMVKIMVEVLDILGTATKEMKQSRARKFLKKVAGIRKLDDGLKKLDKMTNEEVRMATAEALKVTHDIDKKVDGVDEKVQEVSAGVNDVNEKVQGIDENVKVVDEKVQTIINDGKEAATEAKLIMHTTAHKVDEVKRRQLRESLRKWQSPSDPSMNHVIASYCQHEGTAEWFCKGNIFEEWKATGSLLWIHGKPGSGKSILCSAIINDIATLHKAGSAYMAYFYFDFRDVDKQSRRDLLRSLLIQLSARSDPFCDVLSRLYAEHDDGTRQPSDNALMHCLKEMLTLPNQPPVYLIMDALDECPNTSGIPSVREQVLDVVKELVGLRLSSLRICATSRPEVDIRYAIEPLTFCSISIHEEVGQEKDIIEYIKSVVHSPSSTIMKRWRDEDKDMVVKTLSERADGMFRWVFCQLETLQHCFPHNIPHILRQLPATLDETYARVLKEIGKTNQIYAHRLLQCLTVARRPLGVDELAEILALDFTANEGIPELKENWRWKDEQEAVLSTCSSLIVVVVQGRGHRVVQFSHFSVKEFLTSNRLATSSADISRFHILPEPAHTVTAKACLGILLRSQNGVDGPDTRSGSPLTEYAAEHWVDHARFEKVSLRIEDAIRLLFDPEKPHLEAWLKLCDPDDRYPWSFLDYDDNKHLGSPLYYASLYGFRDLAAHLVTENPQYLTGLVGRNPSPLAAALSKKHFDVAELLYQRGMDLGIRDIHNGTLLHAASWVGYVDIVQWLFDHGVPANSQRDNHETPAEANWRQGRGITVDEADDTNHTPLHSASRGGHFEIVRQLLVRGADVTAKTQRHWSPLHLASSSLDVETVRLLIEHGADVTARDRRHKTPLHSVSFLYDAFERSYPVVESDTAPEIVRLLIDHGADVTALDMTHSTPLVLASSLGIPGMVQILLESGADANAQNETHSTPLHRASIRVESSECVRILIEHGADVTARDWDHKTPLHIVSSWAENSMSADFLPVERFKERLKERLKEKVNTIRLLIEHGADVTAKDRTRSMPLHVASSIGSAETVRLLIERGADVSAQNETQSTPLHLASSSGSADTVQLLIAHGADVTAQDGSRRTPLHLASSKENSDYSWEPSPAWGAETVRLLIEHGADVSAQDDAHSTPLHLASSKGNVETVRLLIEHGADVAIRDGSQMTPLHLTSSWNGDRSVFVDKSNMKVDIVRLLIEHGADVSVQDKTQSTPLHLAALSGNSKTVRLLLEHGAGIAALDRSRKTPLHLASSWDSSHVRLLSNDKAEIARLLIEHGADVTAQDENHSTPLHLASSWGSLEIVRLLIERGADVTAQDGRGETPLHLASSWDDRYFLPRSRATSGSNVKANIVRLLIDHGADVTAQDEVHSTPLHLASSVGSVETVGLLIKHGADIAAHDERRRTPLQLASSWDDSGHMLSTQTKSYAKAEIVRLMIDHGADATAQDETRSTPLHLASSFGSADTVRLLIEHGADVTAQDGNYRTPLHLASSWDDNGHRLCVDHNFHAKADTVRLLIDHGADVTAQDETKSTPLHLAASFGSAETVRLLIKHGADVTAQDGNYRTPLHLASSRDEGLFDEQGNSLSLQDELCQEKFDDKADTVRLLILHGADVNSRDDTHSTPLHLASSKGSVETVELLIQHGADVNAQNGDRSTPLHLAASSHRAVKGNIVRLLLKHNADVDAKDSEGRTPLQIASSEGHFWIAKLLSDHHAGRR